MQTVSRFRQPILQALAYQLKFSYRQKLCGLILFLVSEICFIFIGHFYLFCDFLNMNNCLFSLCESSLHTKTIDPFPNLAPFPPSLLSSDTLMCSEVNAVLIFMQPDYFQVSLLGLSCLPSAFRLKSGSTQTRFSSFLAFIHPVLPYSGRAISLELLWSLLRMQISGPHLRTSISENRLSVSPQLASVAVVLMDTEVGRQPLKGTRMFYRVWSKKRT